jgi:hypothetical protein
MGPAVLILAAAGAAAYVFRDKLFKTAPPGSENIAITVQGKSGQVYAVNRVKSVGEENFFDVFLLNGTRVLRYSQIGSDTGTRKYIDSPLQSSDAIFRTAVTDFDLRFNVPGV